MSDRAFFIIQLLEKLGAPLMAATIAASMRGGSQPDNNPEKNQKDAENIAALIGKAIQVSVDLAQKLDLQDKEANADAVRIALAGVASPLIGHHYAMSGNIPGDVELQKIMSGLQAVLTFSDHFTLNPENTLRLEATGLNPAAEGQVLDDVQVNLQYLHALAPIINAVSAFPFGKAENILMQEVTQALLDKAKNLRQSLFNHPEDDDTGKRIDIYLLKTLADIYAACHAQETARLMTLDPADRGDLNESPIDAVWESFDKRLAMLDVLLRSVFSSAEASTKVSEGAAPAPTVAEKQPEPAAKEAPEEKPAEQPVEKAEEKPEEKAPDKAESPKEEGGDYNPMSFFTGGKKEESKEGSGEDKE